MEKIITNSLPNRPCDELNLVFWIHKCEAYSDTKPHSAPRLAATPCKEVQKKKTPAEAMAGLQQEDLLVSGWDWQHFFDKRWTKAFKLFNIKTKQISIKIRIDLPYPHKTGACKLRKLSLKATLRFRPLPIPNNWFNHTSPPYNPIASHLGTWDCYGLLWFFMWRAKKSKVAEGNSAA